MFSREVGTNDRNLFVSPNSWKAFGALKMFLKITGRGQPPWLGPDYSTVFGDCKTPPGRVGCHDSRPKLLCVSRKPIREVMLWSCFFSLKHFGHWNISVICLTVVLKLAITLFLAYIFKRSGRNYVIFSVISKTFPSMTGKNTALVWFAFSRRWNLVSTSKVTGFWYKLKRNYRKLLVAIQTSRVRPPQ